MTAYLQSNYLWNYIRVKFCCPLKKSSILKCYIRRVYSPKRPQLDLSMQSAEHKIRGLTIAPTGKRLEVRLGG